MTTIDPEKLRRELAVRQAIDRKLNALIEQASGASALLHANPSMEVGQLRNLLNVAIETSSIEVIVNFIRYQIARNNRAWGSGNFGQRVIEDLRMLVKRMADDVTEELRQTLGAGVGDQLKDEIYARLVRLYLGYLHRAFYAYKRTREAANA